MAIYHLHVKVIGRKSGSSAVASAAYRSASRLRDDRLERSHDFSNKRGVVHSEVMLPEDVPEQWSDRERLWNDVEAFEVRKDAQLAREVEFAPPREMTQAQGIELALDFVHAEFVDQGMIADLNVHWDIAEDGTPKPHAHVMLTMRSVDENGFGPKVRDWNRTEMVERWRERWAQLANERLAELDIDARIDHRSLEARGLVLSGEQAEALAHVTDGRDLGVVVGYAGTGKSAMLGVAREAWEAAGYEVRGVALSGIAAENLESGSGIASRTIASMEHGWGQGRDVLTSRDVLVIDEAGMVGTRQLERVLSHAAEAGAKVVLVGDPQQLQSIEAGAAFRSIFERHSGAEIGEVRRQREDWQRDATRDLATGRTGDAIRAYDAHGMVHAAPTREQARDDLIDRWDRARQASPDQSRIILTHTNDEVRALNEAARQRMREAGDLGDDVRLTVERGARSFTNGDRVMFLQNERGLGVKNGTLGTVEQVSARSMSVRTDDGRSISFDLNDYDRIDHGYAATIHKAQGMTVDRTHVLATPGLDAHGSYVALSRHRDGMDLHYGRDDFADQDRLIRTLSRDRAKDMATDYERADPAQSFAERRGITFRERVAEIVRKVVPEKVRGVFDGLRLPTEGEQGPERKVEEDPAEALRKARTKALVRHARAVDAIFDAQERGGRAGPEQVEELQEARKVFEDVRPHGPHDAEAAYKKNPELAQEAATGRVNRTIRALQLETELRTDPQIRADRFVESWQKLDRASQRQYQAGDISGYRVTRSAMGDMAKSLERDPQLESILEGRKRDLGIGIDSGRSLGRELAFSHGIDLGRGLGIGL
jgi:ATP-dependent exoDNAse (exonuclease V) alpha subunit